jgi:hypothetical protein
VLAARKQFPLHSAEKTQVEDDIERLLPSDTEDLRIDNRGKYGFSMIGTHTVAGVAVFSQPSHKARRPQRKDDQGAEQARNIANQARQVAEQARQVAEQARQVARHARAHARQHHGGTTSRGEVLDGYTLAFRSKLIKPDAAALELLELRVAIASRFL